MKPFSTTADAVAFIERYEGKPVDFELPIAEVLLDPMGMNMAIITNAILAKEFEPDGFSQEEGYRVYRYKALD